MLREAIVYLYNFSVKDNSYVFNFNGCFDK